MAMNKVKVYSDVELKDRLVAINRVTKVTKGGRTFTFAAIVVVGDGKGVIGYGLGKAGEVTAAIAKGVEAAKKNLVKVAVLKGTLPHEVEARFSGAQVFMKPVPVLWLVALCVLFLRALVLRTCLLSRRVLLTPTTW
jgi:small subunit ribosomal protein S5